MDILLLAFILVSATQHQSRQIAEAATFGPQHKLLSHDPNAPSSKGNEFILGFIGNTDNAPIDSATAALFVTTNDPGPVDFTVEYFGTTQSFEARSGSTTFVNLPVGKPGEIGDIRVRDEAERTKGVHVKSTDPSKLLTVYGINDVDVSTDAFLALPCHRYANVAYKYFVFSVNTESTTGTFQSRFLVIGCEDDTTVTIRPKQQITLSTDLTGAPVPININPDPTQPMNSGSFTIDQLQTAQFSSPDDLTGTIIESDKPISVFVGHECGQVPDTATACDHLVEQIPPSATWGTQFFTVPLNVRESGERYRIGTVTDDNQITVTCTTEGQTTPRLQMTETIHSQRNLQQYVQFDTVGDPTDGITDSYRRDFCCIETTKPAIVMMYSKDHSIDEITLEGVNGTQGDPFMLLIPPVSQYSNDYTVTTAKQVRTDFIGHIGIALSVQFFDNSTIDRNAVTMNGTIFDPSLRGSDYTPIYCSNGKICAYGAYSEVPVGSHEVRYDMVGAGMNLFVYGFLQEISFAYPAGFEMQAIGVPQISIFNITVLESVGTVWIPINRTGGDLSLLSVIRAFSRNVTAIEGQDYRRLPDQNAANPGFRVRWEEDESEPRYITNPNVDRDPIFEFEIIDDDIPELEPPGGEYFEIDLSLNPTGNGRNGYFFPNAVGRVTIIDNDGPPQIGFQPESYTVDETAGVVRLTITTNEPGRFTDGTGALFFTEDGTATGGGVDFTGYTRATAIPITFPAGSTETTIEVPTNNDRLVERTEQFSGRIISGGGIANLSIFSPRATIDITDNDRLIFGFERTAYNFSESVGTGNLGVHLSPDSGLPSENLVFTFSTADSMESNAAVAPGDYTSASLEYTFMPGQTRLDIPVTIIDDTDFEGDEQFLGRLTTSTNAIIVVPVTTVTIDDNELINIGFEKMTYNYTESGEPACLIIRKFNNPSNLNRDINIRFTTIDNTAKGGNDFTTIASTVTLLSHENQTMVCVNITNDEIPEENENFFCKLNVSPESEAFVEVRISQAVVHIEDNDVIPCNSEAIPDRGNCSEYGLCKFMNTAEGFIVDCTSCTSGFIGNGLFCEDIDECTNRLHNCDENAYCSNINGSFQCVCKDGHFGNGTVCLSNTSKIPYPCDNLNFCTCFSNESSSIGLQCGCLPGFEATEIEGGTVVCRDINECLQSSCNGTCINTNGSYHCSCPVGYFYDAKGKICADVNECQLEIDNCHRNATCRNTYGSFSCSCDADFFGDGVTCFNDNMECEQLVLPAMSEAESFECGCKVGYHLNMSTFQQCDDIDECRLAIDDCDENAVCKNTNGGYECECKNGFIGDGTICTDIDECATGIYQCDKNADCSNTIGNFTCQCRDGFFGDGTQCAAGIGPVVDTTIIKVRPNNDLIYTIGTNFCLEDSFLNRMMNLVWLISCELANQPTPKPDFMMTTVVVRNGTEMNQMLAHTDQNPAAYDLNTTLNFLYQEDTVAIKVTCIASNSFGSDNASTLIEPCGLNECQDGRTNMCTQLCSRDIETMTYNCSCMTGYIVNMEDPDMCDDFDECADPAFHNCSATANLECHNTNGSFTCDCKTGYSKRSDGQCEDVNECEINSHNLCSQAHNEECQNTNGSFACICKEGFQRVDAIQHCLDIDECIEKEDNCSLSGNEECVNTNGSYTCECADGYSRDTISGLCSDIDECNDLQSNKCSQMCQITNGSYECYCNSGYTLDTSNNQHCIDINECESLTNCSMADNKECINTNGSYSCNCIPGYFQTEPNGICKVNRECDPPCHRDAECTDTLDFTGNFTCQCKYGYEGDGTSCQDIDECNDPQSINDCSQMCQNTNGSYECYCYRGYTLDTSDNRSCIVSRECDPPCHHDAECTDTSNFTGNFTCQCKYGYEGDGTSCQVSASVIGGTLGALSFLLLTGILLIIVCICCYKRRNSCYDVKQKDNLDIKEPHLDSQFGETTQMFSVQSSYKLNIPTYLIFHSSSIKLLETIGQGEFGIVYKGHIIKDPGPVVTDIVAIKTLKGFYDRSTVRVMMKECSKMYKFDHPNILTLKGVCLDGGPAPYIIMPFMANGSLLAYLHKNRDSLVVIDRDNDDDEVKIVEKQLLDMCLQIAKGMEYLTVMKVVHRDLAARNCMIDMNFVIKVADFGLSESIGTKQYFRQDKFTDIKLPIRWLAPESLEDCVFSQKSDVWAYGVTSWEVFTGGKTPYPGISPPTLPRKLANGLRLEKPMNSACSDEMYAFMLNCWNLDPNARPSFSDLVSSLSQSLEAMVGYMDITAFDQKRVDNSSVVKVPSSEDKNSQSEHISTDVCAETVM